MKKDKIISIAFNFKELTEDLEELSKRYKLSVGAQSILNSKRLDARDPWFDFRNGKWAVILTSEEYIAVKPYSLICKEYLEEKADKLL